MACVAYSRAQLKTLSSLVNSKKGRGPPASFLDDHRQTLLTENVDISVFHTTAMIFRPKNRYTDIRSSIIEIQIHSVHHNPSVLLYKHLFEHIGESSSSAVADLNLLTCHSTDYVFISFFFHI